MPRRNDLESILLIGSGPIVIGQACEFDYAGCQALKVLREDGFRTIVVNSNPATIMTDPGFADRTYLEPLDLEGVAAVIERERPDALLPTMGGQTALNLARELAEAGPAVRRRADRRAARRDPARRGPRALPRRASAASAWPCRSRASSPRSTELAASRCPRSSAPRSRSAATAAASSRRRERARPAGRDAAFDESPIGQVLVEESVRGWDEFELEVVRDAADNVVIVCSIENLDPMGVHTGDSVTVAPQMTLSDEAYQELRDAAAAVVRAVGVECGGSNIQFARNRETGEIRVIEMNPRVSRSSALASKATGYPIAKVAAKLAVGYTLDEIPNDLTRTTPASFEPTLDYVVVKFPRFAFEKFPGADTTLGTQMKSVGESMGIGRTFAEAFWKARRGLEIDPEWRPGEPPPVVRARARGAAAGGAGRLPPRRLGARARSTPPRTTSTRRAASATSARRSRARSVVILGSGPNRIGQGIEFDYCCVHAAQSFRALGYESVMVNCNPETVSTDYDTSDRLYFEPLDEESVLDVCEREQPVGVCIQFGGQTPLKLARAIERAGHRILGTPFDAVDLAEDRERFGGRARASSGSAAPTWGTATSAAGGDRGRRAHRLPGARPALVRPRRPRDARLLPARADRAAFAHLDGPVLVDRFLEGALEIDVDAICDGEETYVAAVMEHVEEAGVHSGDSSCVLPAALARARAASGRSARSSSGSRRRSASSGW